MGKIDKARFWTSVLYLENMREDWRDVIDDVLQVPFAYCIHDLDRDSKSEHRKDHVHVILAFPNTTTYNHAMNVFELLSAEGKKASNTCQAVVSIRNVYDYLIHDTQKCREQGKHLYDASERITGNNFDIGSYEQLDIAEKNRLFVELSNAIREQGIMNYMDFYEFVADIYGEEMKYFEVMRCYSSHFQRMCDGNYQRWQQGRLCGRGTVIVPSQAQLHENSTEDITICCPKCGSISVVKSGKTLANTQRWACKDCGKRFV